MKVKLRKRVPGKGGKHMMNLKPLKERGKFRSWQTNHFQRRPKLVAQPQKSINTGGQIAKVPPRMKKNVVKIIQQRIETEGDLRKGKRAGPRVRGSHANHKGGTKKIIFFNKKLKQQFITKQKNPKKKSSNDYLNLTLISDEC